MIDGLAEVLVAKGDGVFGGFEFFFGFLMDDGEVVAGAGKETDWFWAGDFDGVVLLDVTGYVRVDNNTSELTLLEYT